VPPVQQTYRPGTEPGATRTDIPAIEAYKKQEEARQAAGEKFLGAENKIGDTEDALDRMRKLNKAGVYTGMASSAGMVVEDVLGGVFGQKSQTAVNTELFKKDSADLLAAILKDYGSGNGISDADLKAAANRIPAANDDPRVRAQKIEDLQTKIDGFKWQLPRIRAYLDNNIPLGEAQIRAKDDYRAAQAEQERSKKQQALPNAVIAADNAMPGPTSIPPSSAGTGSTPKVTSDAEYNALPPGTVFIDPEGKRRRK
jgi:hypothetical protein